MPKLGYLLPTRERVMENHHETGSLLALAETAEKLGYDSIWVGDSVTARPRHDPLTLLAAVAARTRKAELGTAVLLPALRNPVLLAHQVATVDRIAEGRLILGIGIASDMPAIRLEFEAVGVPFDKRVGRMNEAIRLCKALWTGKPVDWSKLWTVKQGTVGPTPHRPGGPPIWFGGGLPAGRERTGKLYDGWFPNLPTPEEYPAQIGRGARGGEGGRPRSQRDHRRDVPDARDRRRHEARRRQDQFLPRALLRRAGGADARPPAELRRPGVGRGGVDQELRRCRRHAHHAALRRRA